MSPVGGYLNFRGFDLDCNLAAKTTPSLVLGLMIQINRHLKIHGEMNH